MAELDTTYVFRDDEVFVLIGGKVAAKGKKDELEKVESDATAYLDGLRTEADEKRKKSATHIVSPTGLRGKILNRYAGTWGDELSVRWENGETGQYSAHGVTDWVTEKVASVANPVVELQSRISAVYDHDRASLITRYHQLKDISSSARALLTKGASYAEELELEQIRVTADAEAESVAQAVDHIDAEGVEGFQAPTPQPVAQADLGNSVAGDWLDVVLTDIANESEENDFDKVLNEEPDLLAAELDEGVLADQGAARSMALSHVVSKTAGFEGEEVESFRDQFLARFEQARRRELANRQTTARKEAATSESNVNDSPDEALFG